MNKKSTYGRYYWCVLTRDAEIYVWADVMHIDAAGSLLAVRKNADGTEGLNMAWAAGIWVRIFAASALDGSPIAVEHWDALSRGAEHVLHAARRGPG